MEDKQNGKGSWDEYRRLVVFQLEDHGLRLTDGEKRLAIIEAQLDAKPVEQKRAEEEAKKKARAGKSDFFPSLPGWAYMIIGGLLVLGGEGVRLILDFFVKLLK